MPVRWNISTADIDEESLSSSSHGSSNVTDQEISDSTDTESEGSLIGVPHVDRRSENGSAGETRPDVLDFHPTSQPHGVEVYSQHEPHESSAAEKFIPEVGHSQPAFAFLLSLMSFSSICSRL